MRREKYWALAVCAVLAVAFGWVAHATHLQGRVDDYQDQFREIDERRESKYWHERAILFEVKIALSEAAEHGHCLSVDDRLEWSKWFIRTANKPGFMHLGGFRDELAAAAKTCGNPTETREAKARRLLGELTEAMEVTE